MTNCPICDGAGMRYVLSMHKQLKRMISAVEWCVCMKSRFVSQDSSFKILSALGDEYLPINEIDSQLVFELGSSKNHNLLIMPNTTYESFLFHIKSFLIVNKYADPAPNIYLCDSIDILKDFYVAQDDGTCPGLRELNKFDLLIFTLGSDEKNDQLNTCIAQVVGNRKNLRMPTWIYLKRPFETCQWEKSDILKIYLEYDSTTPVNNGYHKISLRNVNAFTGLMQSNSKKVAKKAAETFRR